MRAKLLLISSLILTFVVMATGLASPTVAQAAPAPLNDHFANARVIPLNKTVRVDAVESATLEAGEPATCPMDNSVWFKFTALFNGSVAMSTVGTTMMRGTANFDSDTVFEVYTGSDLASLTPLVCADEDSAEIAEVDELDIVKDTTYYIRVGAQPVTISGPLIAPSFIKFTVWIRNADNWSVNAAQMDFEGGALTAWSLRAAQNGDGLVCGTGEHFDGTCAVKLISGANERTKLVQTFVWPKSQVIGRTTHYLEFSVNLKIESTAPRVKLMIIMDHGKKFPLSKTRVVIKRDTEGVYKDYEVFAYFARPKVRSVTLVIQNLSTDGTVLVDGAYLDYDGGLLRSAAPLPVPAAAN